MSNTKVKNVKVETSKGTRQLTFVPALGNDEPDKLICDSTCPYGPEICRLLKDPTHPDDPDFSFMDFCGNLGAEEGSDKDLGAYVPMEGTLEANLCDFPEIYQVLNAKNPMVRLDKVINCVCADTCDMYCEDHSMCRPDNSACFLIELLKTKELTKAKAPKKEGETDSSGDE